MLTIFSFLDYVDFSALELDFAGACREKRKISSHFDVLAGEEFRSALPNDDTADLGLFARVQLNASVFRVTVSAVPC
jgi:hypothetical protein